jgi:ribonuclease VapC
VIVDSSALIAIVLDEPATEMCLAVLVESPEIRMSAAGFVEASIVVDRLPDLRYSRISYDLLGDLGIIIEPVTLEQAPIAREAYRQFGKGSGHPARLNFGDCFAYALANLQERDEPLLFVGQDFIHTDIRPALG